MNKIANSLLFIGLSCWFLGGCVGADIDDTEEVGEALVQAEDTSQEQEASSDTEEDLGDSEREGEYSTEWCDGWAGYGSACQVRCSNGGWYNVGHHPNIGSGDCTPAGQGYCAARGMSATGHCWN